MDTSRKARWRDLDWWIPRLMALAVLAVAVFAFTQSYTHGFYWGETHHQTGASLRMFPLIADWIMFAAGLVMLHLGLRNIKHPLPRAVLALGVTVTLAINVAAGVAWGWQTALTDAWAPVALFAAVELGMLLVRTAKAKPAEPKIIPWNGPVEPEFTEKLRQELTKLRPSQPAPDPSPETAAIPKAVDTAPGDPAQGWGQLAGQQAGLQGIGLRNGRQ